MSETTRELPSARPEIILDAPAGNTRWGLIVVLVLTAAMAVRLPFALDEGFTGDEAFCVLIAQCTPWEIMSGMALEDSNPPLYMLFLHVLMRIAPDQVAVWKLATMLLNVSAIAVIMAWIHRSLGPISAGWAGFLAAINPWHIFLATEMRGYALAGLCAAVAVDSADRFERNRQARWAGVWVLAVTAGFWSHYSVAVIGMGTGLITLWVVRRDRWIALLWCVAGAAAVGLMALWVPMMLQQSIQRGGTVRHLMHLAGLPVVQLLGTTFLRPGAPNWHWGLGITSAIVSFGWPAWIGFTGLWRTHRRMLVMAGALFAATILVPLLRSMAIGSLGFSSRYTFVGSFAVFLLVGYGLAVMRAWPRSFVVAGIVLLSVLSLGQLRWSYVGRSLWGEMVHKLETYVAEDEALLCPNVAQVVRIRLLSDKDFADTFVDSEDAATAGEIPIGADYVEISRLLRNKADLFTTQARTRLLEFDAIWYWPPTAPGTKPAVLGDRYTLARTEYLLPGGQFGAEGPVPLIRYERTQEVESTTK